MPGIKPQLKSALEPQWFTEGGNGVAPTYPGADWFNIVQAELLNVLKKAGINPDKANHEQLTRAIQKLGGYDFLIGLPLPYPKTTVPTGCLAMRGQSISQSTYPVLYSLYGGTLPDLRGEFIRGWDNGRGVDRGRTILSAQNSTSIALSLGRFSHNGYDGHEITDHDGISATHPGYAKFKATDNSYGDGISYVSIRPRNIALQYICLAG
ncbi:phage tail protein [Testudinibacter sp. TR-2022]|nr:phage tail protein [Testudinibacter sp. TR-2022]